MEYKKTYLSYDEQANLLMKRGLVADHGELVGSEFVKSIAVIAGYRN